MAEAGRAAEGRSDGRREAPAQTESAHDIDVSLVSRPASKFILCQAPQSAGTDGGDIALTLESVPLPRDLGAQLRLLD